MKLVINDSGEIKFGKNGRIKNYDLQETCKNLKINLPAYFVGTWSTDEWTGYYKKTNPNMKGKKSI